MIEIDYQLVTLDTLDNILAEIVLREGTDYGEAEVCFEHKKQQLFQQLSSRKAKLIYDSKTNQCDILTEISSAE